MPIQLRCVTAQATWSPPRRFARYIALSASARIRSMVPEASGIVEDSHTLAPTLTEIDWPAGGPRYRIVNVHHGLFDATWLHGHENHELVAASPRNQPDLSDHRVQAPADCHQHPITFCVTQIVVDALERIDIDHHRKDYVSLEFADTEQLLPDIVQPTYDSGQR